MFSPVKEMVKSALPSLMLLSTGVTVIVASYDPAANSTFPFDGLTVNRELSPVTLKSNVAPVVLLPAPKITLIVFPSVAPSLIVAAVPLVSCAYELSGSYTSKSSSHAVRNKRDTRIVTKYLKLFFMFLYFNILDFVVFSN